MSSVPAQFMMNGQFCSPKYLTGKMLVISDFGDQSKLHLCRVQLSIFYVNLASNVIVEGRLDFEVAVAESLRRCWQYHWKGTEGEKNEIWSIGSVFFKSGCLHQGFLLCSTQCRQQGALDGSSQRQFSKDKSSCKVHCVLLHETWQNRRKKSFLVERHWK